MAVNTERRQAVPKETIWKIFSNSLTGKVLPYFLFLGLLGLIYIANTHYAERKIRKINTLKMEVEDLRIDYTTLKAESMFMLKRSELVRKASELGLQESEKPFIGISTIKKEE